MLITAISATGCAADRGAEASGKTAKLLIEALALSEGGEDLAELMIQQPETQARQACIASYLYIQNWSEQHHADFLTLTNGTGNLTEPNPELSEEQTMKILAPLLSAFEACQ
ncbi:hypothetical protein [uncultured Pseudoteredinibacter sp.]|uniref:hypothetical protein n=1 Tax=uncultured Pseudoteredinibacter sp. TaxID=1641701 RepID=UPI00262C939F|nr:hypothetical protein [uncultured Pseudoteredinibacter sp.]